MKRIVGLFGATLKLLVFLCIALMLFYGRENQKFARATTLGPLDGHELTATDLERVKVGDPAPDFTLEAETGTPVTLSQFRGKKPVILVFYRGHW